MSRPSTIEKRPRAPARETVRQAVFKDIVCGVDGSRGSRLAVHQAVALSGQDGGVRFASVSHAEGFGLNEMSTLGEDRAAEALQEARSVAESRGAHASCELISAPRASTALRSEAAGSDLLVIGSHGVSRRVGIILGSVVTQIAHRCEQPLLIARRVVDHGDFPETVLLATDGSAGSWPAARVVARLAALRDAEVHVVHVPDGSDAGASQTVREQLMLIAGETGSPPGFRDRVGAVPERICQAARASQAALVVLGRRGLGGVRALGSVSERVAHRAHSSVLLVPADEAGR